MPHHRGFIRVVAVRLPRVRIAAVDQRWCFKEVKRMGIPIRRREPQKIDVDGRIRVELTKKFRDEERVSGDYSKGKLWVEKDDGGRMDELLEVMGYKVKQSDMADVALKIEQLDMAMGAVQEEWISQPSDTVHYNTSDLSSWLDSMLSELNPVPLAPSAAGFGPTNATVATIIKRNLCSTSNSSIIYEDNSEYDLRAIPGIVAYKPPTPPPQQIQSSDSNNKRMKHEPRSPATIGSTASSSATSPTPASAQSQSRPL
ncbi:hypothetical protein V2J09_015148 [Rumex salicifolius]